MANKKVLSIYVGNDAIRVAEMQDNKGMVTLSNAAEISTPDNAVNDGYIVDVSAVAEAIRASLFGRGFSSKDVIFTITSKKIASKEVEIPYVKNEKKLQSILQANSSEYFPMSNSGDYSFAYSILEDFTNEEGHKCRVSAVAAPYDLLKGYYELAEELKYNVASIDYFGNSVIQLLSMQMTPGRVDLVLQIEKDATFVNVMRGKTLVLQRNVPYGKNAVINALMDVKKISEKDAKTLLSNETLLEQHVTAEEYAETVQYLVSGIGRVVEYHRNKNQNDVLQGIKVFGEGSAIAGIERILERELGAPVQHFDTLNGVSVKGQAALTAEEVLRYLPNIGAVIKPINLEINEGTSGMSFDTVRVIKYLRYLFVAACVVMVCWIGYTIFESVQAKNEEKELKKKIAAIEDIELIYQQYLSSQTQLDIVKNFDASTKNDNYYIYDFFMDLETMMPYESYVTEFEAINGDVVMKIKSGYHEVTKNETADVIVNVGNIAHKNGYCVTGLTIEEVTESNVYRFKTGEVDAEGNDVYLREEPEADDPNDAGEFVEYEVGSDIDDDLVQKTKGCEMVMLVSSEYEVRLHIGLPAGAEEVEEEVAE